MKRQQRKIFQFQKRLLKTKRIILSHRRVSPALLLTQSRRQAENLSCSIFDLPVRNEVQAGVTLQER